MATMTRVPDTTIALSATEIKQLSRTIAAHLDAIKSVCGRGTARQAGAPTA